ncbi:hypothetical protein CEXT_558651 [Caerostris extrusa]|uniref:Uncharacterized protein n=1 Tax=Caerostris extrusa TaxID=172846 RepID=A0AAV4WQD9_CAEEX|nr:hypothetical protein CEXT_558651 [Caerostris extrusa]
MKQMIGWFKSSNNKGNRFEIGTISFSWIMIWILLGSLCTESTQCIAVFQVGVAHLLQLQKSAHVIHLNKKYSSPSAETITIDGARHLYPQSSETNNSDAAKINTAAPNIEELVNQRVQIIVQSIMIKMEQQTTILIEIFQKLLKILCNIWSQCSIKMTSKNPPTESAT